MAAVNVNKLLDEGKLNWHHWMIFVLGLCIIAFDGYDLYVFGGAIPILMKQWGLTPPQAGVMGSYALLGAGIGGIGLGYLADKIGRKPTLIFCAVLYSVATGCTGLTNDITTFSICRVLAGVGIGGSIPNVVALISEYAPIKNRAFMIGSVTAGMQIGGVLAAGIGMWFLPAFGWRSVFYVGFLPLILIPLFLKYLPESPEHYLNKNRVQELKDLLAKLRPELSLAADTVFEVAKSGGRSPIVNLFRENRGISTVAIWFVFALDFYMNFGLSLWLPKMMMDAGFPLGSSLWFLLTLNVGAWIGIQIMGVMADRIGVRPMLYFSYVLAFVTIASLSMTKNFYAITLLVALAGIGVIGGQALINAYGPLFYPPSMRSTGAGFAFGVGRIGAILGPVITGILMTMNLSLFGNFLGLAIPGLLACVAVFCIQDRFGFSAKPKSGNPDGK